MCSIDDDILTEESKLVIENESSNQKFDICSKCKINAPRVVLRKKDAYCKECFLIGTTHKFKAQLGKSKLIRPLDKVLVYHKIGHAGTALLHFLRSGLDLKTPKKIKFQPIILFVDDLEIMDKDEKRNFMQKISSEIISLGFKPHFISYSSYLNHNGIIADIITSDLNLYKDNEYSKNNGKHISSTKKLELKNIHMRNLLLKSAKCFECKYIFTSEISLDISALLLTNVCLGRGSNINDDTGFSDMRSEIKILRPLRTFDTKELVFYNSFNKLESINIKQSDNNSLNSVQNLMVKFVNDLKISFPATVSTVLRTSEKVAGDESGVSCKFCKGSIHSNKDILTSEESTMFSKLVSTETQDSTTSRQDQYNALMEKFLVKSSSTENVCYACTKLMPCIEN